jgi:hypothetical protein
LLALPGNSNRCRVQRNVFGKGKVRCELSYSRDLVTWERILPGSSLIAHGSTGQSVSDPDNAFDSHMCYAGAHPVKLPSGDIRMYYSVQYVNVYIVLTKATICPWLWL